MTAPTPPLTSVSPPVSPTTSDPTAKVMSTARPLYLIVATALSPPLGIGLRGTLPWGPIKADMTFFARVTRRTSVADPRSRNTVIMGRKTYDSIPRKFRPLQGRRNVVITRSDAGALQEQLRAEIGTEAKKQDVICENSIGAVIDGLQDEQITRGKVFIIGGSEIYRTALHEDYRGIFTHLRMLQSEIQRQDGEILEIDTFFPVNVQKDRDWRKASDAEVALWVGEEVPQSKTGNKLWKEDGDYKFRTVGWEKELSGS